MIKMKSSSIKYNHIAIEGNIGSGKTTLAKKLSKDLESRLLLESLQKIHSYQNFISHLMKMHFL